MNESNRQVTVPTDSVTARVVGAVADEEGVDPTELSTPLFEAVDPDALEDVFPTPPDADVVGRIEFTYCGYDVTVDSHGEVTVDERSDRR